MKYLLVLLMFSLSACGTAQLVSTRLKPVKSGTVKLSKPGVAARQRANELMARFCAPLNPKILGTDSVTETTGAYAVPGPYFTGVSYDSQTSPLVHFECTSGPAELIERGTYDSRFTGN